MAAVLRDSVLYDKLHVKKYLGDGRDRGGRVVPIPFEITIVSPRTIGDTYNLCVLPANCEVVDMQCRASVDLVGLITIGDAGAAARYLASTDFSASTVLGTLAQAGLRYRPAADTVVVMTINTSAGALGGILKGCFFVVPAA